MSTSPTTALAREALLFRKEFWTPDNKIEQVIKADGLGKDTIISYVYDGLGNRISKSVKITENGNTISEDFTYYIRDVQGNILSTYSKTGASLVLEEQMLYGSDLLGVWKPENNSQSLPPISYAYFYNRKIGNKQYSIKDHLGNVRVTFADKKIPANGQLLDFYTETQSVSTYYPFGWEVKPLSWAFDTYRFGYNSKEKDGDLGALDYGFRIYSPRIGKFLSVDPIGFSLPWNSSYSFAENDVVRAIDIEGLEKKIVTHYSDGLYWNGDVRIIKTDVKIQKNITFQGENGKLYAMTEVFLKFKEGKKMKVDEIYEIISPHEPKPSANYDYTQNVIPGKFSDDLDFLASDQPIKGMFKILKRDFNAPDNTTTLEDLGGVEATLFLSLSPLQRNLLMRAKTQSIGIKNKFLEGIHDIDDVMEAGKAFVGKNPIVKTYPDGKIIEMVSKDGLKRFRPPRFKSDISKTFGEKVYQGNFEIRTSKNIKWKSETGVSNLHIRTKGSYYSQ